MLPQFVQTSGDADEDMADEAREGGEGSRSQRVRKAVDYAKSESRFDKMELSGDEDEDEDEEEAPKKKAGEAKGRRAPAQKFVADSEDDGSASIESESESESSHDVASLW